MYSNKKWGTGSSLGGAGGRRGFSTAGGSSGYTLSMNHYHYYDRYGGASNRFSSNLLLLLLIGFLFFTAQFIIVSKINPDSLMNPKHHKSKYSALENLDTGGRDFLINKHMKEHDNHVMEARQRREREQQQLKEAAASKDAENNNQPAQKEVPLTDLETKVADNIADVPLETKAVEENIKSSDSNSLKDDDAAIEKTETQGSQTNSDDAEKYLENSLPRQDSKNGDESLHSNDPSILNVAVKEGSEKPDQFQNEMKPEPSSEQIKNKRFNNQETLSDPNAKIEETNMKFDGNSDKAKGVREQKVEEHEQPVNSDSSVRAKDEKIDQVVSHGQKVRNNENKDDGANRGEKSIEKETNVKEPVPKNLLGKNKALKHSPEEI